MEPTPKTTESELDIPSCRHVEPGALACLECRWFSITPEQWENHPCRPLIEATLKDLPPLEAFESLPPKEEGGPT